ncbi:MAG: ATP-binding protein [Desulfosarcinaceae bacterium]|nr:ATP-binding protein [Desulfosarcinaceae bacterium]
MGEAIHAYDMIADGDRIAVGLSGGKDSLTLVQLLHDRLGRAPIHYAVFPIYIDPGFEGGFGEELARFCSRNGWHLHWETTNHGIVAHSAENRENPCFLCARLRRKRLFEIADTLGCRKIALGHNKDDLIETLFLNICYSGQISTMVPAQPFFHGRFTIIRPLAFAEENKIRRFVQERDLPRFENPCPSAKRSKRREIKDLLERLYRRNPKIRGNIFRSMSNVKLDYLLKK